MPIPRLALPDVSLVAVTSVAIDATARAVMRSMERVAFAQTLWISDKEPPAILAGSVTWCRIEPLTSRAAYSRFMLRELGRWVQTSHVLTVQWDGFVTVPDAWDPTFLDYDYIGAPWSHFGEDAVVGNGGFSLRSKRLLEAVTTLPAGRDEPEDIAICRTWRTELEDAHGIRFSPAELAQRFSRERTPAVGLSFGFHGIFNLAEWVDEVELLSIVRTLEPALIARNELAEVFWGAIAAGRWTIARAAVARYARAGR